MCARRFSDGYTQRAVVKLDMIMLYFWLGAIVFFGILEAITAGITSIWFAAGALLAMIATAFGAELWLQIIIFIIASALLLYFTRALVKRFVVPKITATNAGSLIGQTAVVTEDIDNIKGMGAVRIAGKVWTARSDNGDIILSSSVVTVKAIEGVKLIVNLKDRESGGKVV
jgi:membrane protein implicated in regulation of membrane protease activity